MTTVLPYQSCLVCGHRMDRHAQLAEPDEEDAEPETGDVTLCIRCGYVMIYDDDLRFRHPTPAERAEFLADERIAIAIAAINRMNQMRNQ